MTDPHEIIEAALADAHDIDMTDDLYAAAILRKLEAAGYVIVDPDNVTDGMKEDFYFEMVRTSDLILSVSAALRAAPQWSKGSEG